MSALDICVKAAKIFEILGMTARAEEARTLGEEFRQAARAHFVEWKYGDSYFAVPIA